VSVEKYRRAALVDLPLDDYVRRETMDPLPLDILILEVGGYEFAYLPLPAEDARDRD
jgi:hypothetical protein